MTEQAIPLQTALLQISFASPTHSELCFRVTKVEHYSKVQKCEQSQTFHRSVLYSDLNMIVNCSVSSFVYEQCSVFKFFCNCCTYSSDMEEFRTRRLRLSRYKSCFVSPIIYECIVILYLTCSSGVVC